MATRSEASVLSSSVYDSALTPPPGTPLASPRRRIDERLDRATHRPLTVVCAPAGFGKTAALADFYSSLGSGIRARSWLSLGQKDDSPTQFWSSLVASIARTLPGALERTLRFLSQGGLPHGENFTSLLVNDLCMLPEPIVAIIDDFHEVTDAEILATFAEVVDNLPAGVRFLVATRTYPDLPLLRWAGRGVATELRVDVLRFTDEEARAYLDLTIAGELSASDTEALIDRCEGWIACLYLAAMGVLESQDPRGFVAALTTTSSPLASYLLSEVVESLPEPVSSFLEDTSVVPNLSVPLSDWLTGRGDSGEVLGEMERMGIFGVSSHEPKEYRCHALLRSLLYARLSEDRKVELHRRASAWLSEKGLVSEAIDQAISGSEWADAIQMLIDHQDALLRQDPRIVRRLIGRIPPGVGHPPDVLALRIKEALISGSLPELRRLLPKAPRVVQMVCTALEGDHLSVIEGLNDSRVQGIDHTMRLLLEGWALTASDRFEEGAAKLRHAIRANDNDSFLELAATCVMSWNRVAAGRLGAGKVMAESAITRAAGKGIRWFHPVRYAEFALAHVLFDRGRLEDAYRAAIEARDAPTHDTYLAVSRAVLLSRIQWALGDGGGARETLGAAATMPDGRPVVGELGLRLTLAQAELYLRDLDAGMAEAWLPDWRSRVERGESSYEERMVLARFLIADDRGDEARELLEHYEDEAAAPVRFLLEAWKLSALAGVASGDPSAAMMLEIALSMGEHEGFVQTFIDDAGILASVQSGSKIGLVAGISPVHSALVSQREPRQTAEEITYQMVEGLTDRELAVLRYLPGRLSNKEIADALYISINTVKSHTKSIYRKLGVSSRNEAVERATSLRIR